MYSRKHLTKKKKHDTPSYQKKTTKKPKAKIISVKIPFTLFCLKKKENKKKHF